MLVSLVRACRRALAGAAWLLDYTVAVVLSAWDGVSVPRPTRAVSPPAEPIIDFATTPARVFPRPGRAAASLALIGVISISVLGALWSQPASEGAPASVVVVEPNDDSTVAVAATATSVLLWAPLIADEPAADVPVDSPAEVTAEPTVEATTAPQADPPAPAPVAAAAAETPTPEPTPEAPPPATPAPAPAPESPPAPEPPPAPSFSGQMTKASVRAAALQVGWPEAEVDELVAVAWCESRFRVEANGWGALGLMQIMPFWFESLGIDVALAFDASTNLKVAYHIYQNDLKNGYDEWASWTCKPLGLPATAP
ncbi:MAG: lytic transglycosylase domain-containing protein [Dehalococcoidia bacterium]